MSTDRIIIHAEIADAFLAAMKKNIVSMANPSSPSVTVVSSASKDRLDALVSGALAQGAHKLMETPKISDSEASKAMFVPTIIGGLTEEMALWQDEAFGPLAGYMIVNTEDEAIEVANKTNYGLSAAVFTRDLRKGLAVAKKLSSG